MQNECFTFVYSDASAYNRHQTQCYLEIEFLISAYEIFKYTGYLWAF